MGKDIVKREEVEEGDEGVVKGGVRGGGNGERGKKGGKEVWWG